MKNTINLLLSWDVADESLLEQMMDYLGTRHADTVPQYDILFQPGQAVICRFSQDDLFYRATIQEVHDDGIKVHFSPAQTLSLTAS